MRTVLRKLLNAGKDKGRFGTAGLLRRTEAAELLEFALALPLILIMVVGILDFASAYHLQQELANAARAGARLGASESALDISQTTPASVQSIKDDVTTYLQNAGVNTSFISSTMTPVGNYTWTYYSSGNYGLMIERNYMISTSSGDIQATRVTLTYPYNWTYGFNNVMKLLIPSSSMSGTITLSTNAAMPQL